ncbi:hypothetical protein VIGAN_08352400 [Vigna angularis var. angularis]|uniref:Late embryogenesis abundant protein LEA-2 subgroup domain-containing protein n=1 Tax=Vigna angularis var. angularis TaxID=157739 RepID=A0A0S3SUV6_PHAAN|nr:hypothetical protein VIGAN_08352400 [Vigna angularis var. angularis]
MPMNNRNLYVNLLHIGAAMVILCLLGMTIILLCIVFTPHLPSFEVTSLTVTPLPINATAQQNQTVFFHFEGLMQNPNSVLAVWYKKPHLELWFNQFSVASVALEPPHLSNGIQINIPFQVEFTVGSQKVLGEVEVQRRAHVLPFAGCVLSSVQRRERKRHRNVGRS